MNSTFASISGMVVLLAASSLMADEEKVPLSEVPKAVLDAVKLKFPEAQLKEAEKETVKNVTTYEISLLDKGTKITASVGEKGKIKEIESEIAVADLPKAVSDAIARKYPKATIKKAEQIIEFEDDEEEKAYEAEVVTSDGKTIEVKVEADGEIEEGEGE